MLAQDGETSAGRLAAGIDDLSRTAVSSHLGILRAAGLVAERREGRFRLYSLEPGPVDDVMAFMASRRNRDLGGPIFGYATMLAAMAAAANYLDTDLSPASRRLTAAGAGLFMLSDTMLGMRKFVFTDPPAALETGVMATYTAAQFLLSEGAARA